MLRAVAGSSGGSTTSATWSNKSGYETDYRSVYFTDVGVRGAEMVYITNRWYPIGGRVTYAKLGAEVTGITNTAVRVLRAQLPAAFFKDNDDIDIVFTLYDSGTTDNMQLTAYIGPTGDSTDTAITGMTNLVLMGATPRAGGYVYTIKRVSATSVKRVGNQAASSSGYASAGNTVQVAATTVPDMDAAAFWISLYFASNGTADTGAVPTCEIVGKTP